MAKLVCSFEEARSGIESLNESLPTNLLLADRLGQAHAFYTVPGKGGEVLFGFSKYVGYKDMDPATYLRDYKALDGRNTEHALSPWFDEVRLGSPTYRDLHAKLTEWLAEYGKRPRTGKSQHVRIMVAKPDAAANASAAKEDRRLLELLAAVADTLPISQRHELRSRL